MQKIKQILNKLFYPLLYLTLFSIPFQIRKVILFVFENEYFHETLSVSIYLSDILVILCITCGLLLFYNEIAEYIKEKTQNLSGVLRSPLFWLGLFVSLQTVTLFNADNIEIGMFRITKIVGMALLGCILYLACRDAINRVSTIWVIALSGSIQALWGILQFFKQKSLGLIFLKESILSPSISGVAKIAIGGQKYIRAYGGLPHSNILAGFLLISILCTIMWIFSRIRKFSAPTMDSLPPFTPPRAEGEQKLTLVCSSVYMKITLLCIQLVGFVLAASFSAMLGLVVGIGIMLVYRCNLMGRDVAMQRLYSKGESKVTLVCSSVYMKVTLVLIVSVSFLLGGLVFLRKEDLFIKNSTSVSERIAQYREVASVVSKNKNWIWGVGTGDYVGSLRRDAINRVPEEPSLTPLPEAVAILQAGPSKEEEKPWEKQPVHNVFALILAENGIIGLILFCVFLVLLLVETPLISVFLPIMLFDHYLYTMQQGMLIFVILTVVSYVMQELRIK